MNSATSAPPWWDDLPLAPSGPHLWPETDLCGTCGISRDHVDPAAAHEHADWRIAGYTGAYDEIPDGTWDEPKGLTARNCHDDPAALVSYPFVVPMNYQL